MAANRTGRATNDVWVLPYGLVCFATLALMALTEQFADLPAAVVALAAARFIVRM